ncbi:hypothetical protein MCOR25_003356 [Pyricularia grisea]|nr:hypothetical protein MCOR25_003356 [Pyricularia grisea]
MSNLLLAKFLFVWALLSPDFVSSQRDQPQARIDWTDGRSFVAPPSELFGKRLGCTIAVLDDCVFVDGGSITWNRGNLSQPIWATEDTNKSIMIPIKSDGAAGPEDYHIVDKPSGFFLPKEQGLWVDTKATPQRVYSWGGSKSAQSGKTPAVEAFRKFTRSNKQGDNYTGSWAAENQLPSDGSTDRPILSNQYATWATCNDIGIMVGGRFGHEVTSSGFITYNMTTGKWSNDTSQVFPEVIKDQNSKKDIAVPNTYKQGAAVCLPTMGTGHGGLVFFIAGSQTSADPRSPSDVYMPMETVQFYDTLTRTFHKQSTSGAEMPALRSKPCIVATQARGSDGLHSSYEIFMFGGQKGGHLVDADIWILTIPGFRWFKAPDTEPYNARIDHDCAVIGPGRRHMISVGGRNDNSDIPGRDYWMNGVGIYDMTNLTWSVPHVLDGPAYEKPQAVREWYAAGNLDSVVFENRETARIFGLESQSSGEDSGSQPSPPSPPSPPSEQTQLPIAAIVGGVLAGVVVILSAVSAAIFIRRRRRRQDNSNTQEGNGEVDKKTAEASDKPLLDSTLIHELAPGTKAHEMSYHDNAVHEMPGTHGAAGELQDRDIAIEMHHDSRPQELPGSDVVTTGR